MRILLLGAQGQVGWELQRSLSCLANVSAHARNTADLSLPSTIVSLIQSERPDIVINAAAYTAVDQAETDEDTAYQVNAKTVELIAAECKAVNAMLIHFSTDYVFDGQKETPYDEQDETYPQLVYGASKCAGEEAIVASDCDYFILRTSWVYAARGNNFAKTMLKLASEKTSLSVVNDQFGAPTSAEFLADIVALIVSRVKSDALFIHNNTGFYHVVASGETTWFGFAQYVLEQAEYLGYTLNVAAKDIQPVPTSDFPRPAKRPANSRLSTQKLCDLLNISIPRWQFYVSRMVNEYLEERI
jgi:dTDP-4-dehydrorhamnose reductase